MDEELEGSCRTKQKWESAGFVLVASIFAADHVLLSESVFAVTSTCLARNGVSHGFMILLVGQFDLLFLTLA